MVADRAEREEDGSPEIVLSGNILGYFTESKQTQDLIVNLQMSCMEPVSREACAQRFKVIMDNYQEQPHLLDPHLGWMLELLLEIIQDKSSSPDLPPGLQIPLYHFKHTSGSEELTTGNGFDYMRREAARFLVNP
ncbi:tubulin-specific chaperone D-like [Hyperolius riggenbachi]|uniref:tubulin-specific chaperone D-like n=1 Tax=Hyperolius riggenbachi TaxID=752182 RepID=UPI0035A3D0AC